MTKVRLISIIGHGSFGTVYKAVWRGTVVASKVLQIGPEDKRVLFEVEKCRLVCYTMKTHHQTPALLVGYYRQLQHPNIVQVMGSLLHEGQLMIFMALVDGDNLHNIIFGGKHQVVCNVFSMCDVGSMPVSMYTYTIQLTPTIKVRIAVQLCQAVVFLHTNSPPLAHLDIKPSNILVRMLEKYYAAGTMMLMSLYLRLNKGLGKSSWQILGSAR